MNFNQSKIRHYKIAIRTLKFKVHNSESKIMNYFDDVFSSNFESYCVRPFSLHFGFPGIAKCLSDFSSLCVLLIILTNVGHPLLLRRFLFYSFSFNCKFSMFDFRFQIRSHALFSVFSKFSIFSNRKPRILQCFLAPGHGKPRVS